MDRDTFLKGLALPEREVELSAGIVVVRALSRGEVVALAPLRDNLADLERRLIRLAFVEPALDDDDVALWYDQAPSGDVDLVVTAIGELSGMMPDSPKSGLPGLRGA